MLLRQRQWQVASLRKLRGKLVNLRHPGETLEMEAGGIIAGQVREWL